MMTNISVLVMALGLFFAEVVQANQKIVTEGQVHSPNGRIGMRFELSAEGRPVCTVEHDSLRVGSIALG